ncbi:unnamed protein product [Rhizoctonia solani]|uniref:Uncharacterized protein n=1 Tax=Rhizoctonia solani TaxID=456999 RepID=A0A8H3A3F2_9AGAM|nr:unnamed protein product [Rhizoctonia solani]
MTTQVWPQVTFFQDAFTPNVFDFSFMDSQYPVLDSFPATDLPNTLELPYLSGVEFDEQLTDMVSNLTTEQIQQMLDSFSTSLATLPQGVQPTPFKASFQQETPSHIYVPTDNVLPQPSMTVPSQTSIGSESTTPFSELSQPAAAAPSSKDPNGATFLSAISLIKLNMRFNPLFQKMGLASCPDRIDLRAGMEREDAMIMAGYLPQTHIPWEQAVKLLGKQGFRSYYYSEVKWAKASNIELPPVPEWIRRYCLSNGGGNTPARVGKQPPTVSSAKNKQMTGRVMFSGNNPTEQSTFVSRPNKGKGKMTDTQRYNPYIRQ